MWYFDDRLPEKGEDRRRGGYFETGLVPEDFPRPLTELEILKNAFTLGGLNNE